MQNQQSLYEDATILKLMRNRFLMDLVFTEGDNKYNVKGIFSDLNMNPSFSFPALALMEPSGFFPNEHEKRKYMEQIMDYLQQYVAVDSVIFMDDEGRIGVLFSWISKDFIESVQSKLNNEFPIHMNIGVGNPCNSLVNIHVTYQQALDALQHKFYKGVGTISYYSELGHYQELQKYPIEKEKELFQCIKHADSFIEVEKAVHYFYNYILKNGLLESKSIYELTIRLLVGIEKRAHAENGDITIYNHLEIISIMNMETLQDIKEYVSQQLIILHEILAYNDNHRSVIKKALQYMERECQHATLQTVADKVYMTPTYLSSLFKINTGHTFIAKLTQIRIEKAKEMLKRTHLKNYEVAEMVGYKDSRYFSQIFKKKVGVTPSEFRELVESAG